MKGAIARAEQLHSEIGKFVDSSAVQQSGQSEVHRRTTAEEIWKDSDGRVDILVSAVGTGGTITGVAEVLKAHKPSFSAIAVEPQDSPVISQTRRGEPVKPGPHKIQGTGAGFVPKNLNLDIVDDVVTVTNEDAIATARRLAGAGGAAGGHLHRSQCLGRPAGGQAARKCWKADRDYWMLHRRALPEYRFG